MKARALGRRRRPVAILQVLDGQGVEDVGIGGARRLDERPVLIDHPPDVTRINDVLTGDEPVGRPIPEVIKDAKEGLIATRRDQCYMEVTVELEPRRSGIRRSCVHLVNQCPQQAEQGGCVSSE